MKAKVKFTGIHTGIETNLICRLEEVKKGVYMFLYCNITMRQWKKLKRIYENFPYSKTTHEIVKVYMKKKRPYKVSDDLVIIEEEEE